MARDVQLSENASNRLSSSSLPVPPVSDVPIICSDVVKSTPIESTIPPVDEDTDFAAMEDEDILNSLLRGELKDHQLEKKLGDYERAVRVRRGLYEQYLNKSLDLIPYEHFDYKKVFGANCEIVLGYVPIPLGIVGPLVSDLCQVIDLNCIVTVTFRRSTGSWCISPWPPLRDV